MLWIVGSEDYMIKCRNQDGRFQKGQMDEGDGFKVKEKLKGQSRKIVSFVKGLLHINCIEL